MDFEDFKREVAALKARLAERDARIDALQDRVSQAAALIAQIDPNVGEQKSSAIIARLQLLLGKSPPG